MTPPTPKATARRTAAPIDRQIVLELLSILGARGGGLDSFVAWLIDRFEARP